MEKIFEDKHPFVEEFENAIVLPELRANIGSNGGILDTELRFVENSKTRKNTSECDFSIIDFQIPEQIPYVDENVIYGGFLMPQYGHFLIESCSRLWYYLKHNPNNYKIVFSTKEKYPPHFIIEFFELLGIPQDKIIYVSSHMRFKKVILPEMAACKMAYGNSDCFQMFKEEFLLPFKKVKEKIKSKGFEKVYLSRSKFNGTSCGEEEIEIEFRKQGFQIVYPEQLPLYEQIAILKDCTFLAGVDGSVLLNCLFMKDGGKLLCLQRSDNFLSQDIYYHAKNLTYLCAKSYQNPLPVKHTTGPFLLGFTKELKQAMVNLGLKSPKCQFNPQRYYREFYRKWLQTYVTEDNYFSIEKRIDARKFLKSFLYFDYCQQKKWYLLFKLLEGITFGRLKRYFKGRYKNIKEMSKIFKNIS